MPTYVVGTALGSKDDVNYSSVVRDLSFLWSEMR